MKNLIKKILFTLFVLIIIHKIGYNQTDREFWFAIPKITTDNCQGGGCVGGQPMYLRLAAYDFPAEVIVDMPASGDTLATFTIPANSDWTVDLTTDRALVEVIASNIITPQGIHISSDNLIMAFYEVDENKNAEMWIMKGEHALGEFFYVPMQNLWANDALGDQPVNAIYVVATEDATDVEITITAASGIYNAGDVISITLDEGDVYPVVAKNYTGADHLGGTKVEVTNGKKVVVITSDDSVGPAGGGGDTNGDQIVPIDHIGYKYVILNAGLSDKVFIIPSANLTDISIDGISQGLFNEGQLIKFDISAVTLIEASEPIWVYHISDFGNEVGGAILPPSDGCTGSYDVTIFRTNQQKFILNIMVPFAGIDGFDIEYDDGTSFHMPSAWFVPVDPADLAGLYVLRDADKEFGDAYGGGIPKDVATKIVNTLDVFHLGVVSTAAARHVKYGYFSDFGRNEASVEVIDATIPGNEAKIGCFGDTVQLLARGGTSYEWYDQLTGDQKYLSDPFIADPVLIDLPVYPLYKYNVYVGGDCADTTLTVYVKINPNVEAFFQIDKAIGCAPLNVNIDNLTSGANRFLWDFNGDGIWDITTADSARVTDTIYQNQQLSDTSYTTRLYVENKYSCWDLFERNIYVHPEIKAGFDQDIDADCNPFDVQFTDTSSGNLDQYYWDFGDGIALIDTINPLHTYSNYLSNDTVYTATLITTSPYNCKDTATKDITVHPYIEANFSVSKNVGCAPYDVTVTNLSTGGITTYSWDYGDGFTSTAHTPAPNPHVYTNATALPIDYNLRLVVANANACTDTMIRVIRVYPLINADYSVDVDEGCNTLDVVFTNSSTGESLVDWDFGDGITSNSTAATINHTYNNYFTHDTIFGFSLHVESDYGCSDDTTGNITVYRTKARFAIDTAEGCSPLNVNISNTSVGSNLSYEWIFGDGTANDLTDNPVSHTYNNTDGTTDNWNLELKLEGTNGCRDSLSYPIIVYSSIDVSFIPVNSTICDSNSISFNSSLSDPIAGTIYDWDFGDGTSSSGVDPIHIYRNLTSATLVTYPVTLNVETPNGCTDAETGSINVRPYVNAKFTVDSVVGCSPLTVDPVATYYIGINQYRWDFGDGTPIITGQNPAAHTYPVNPPGANDIYTLRLDVLDPSGNCTDSATKTITVYDEALADFNPKNSTDCNPYILTFDNLSLNAATYKWDFDDGGTTSSDFEPTYTFTNSTNATKPFNVELEVTSDEGCTDVTTSAVNVYPYVNADFDIDVASGCSPLPVTIINKSAGGNYRFFWDDDDLITADSTFTTNNTFTKVFNNSSGSTKTFNLTLIVRNGAAGSCYDTLQKVITVYSSINAAFSVSDSVGCHPLPVTFTDETVGGSISTWDFGDGTSSNLTNPTHTYENYNTVDVTYTAVKLVSESSDGCLDSVSRTITVYSYLDASFTMDDDEGCPPFPATMENTSIGNVANTYQWLIDNNPVAGSPTDKSDFDHTYENLLTSIRDYEVKLIATNPRGCISEHIDSVTVYEYVEASFNMIPTPTEACNPFEVDFQNLSTVPATIAYLWDFDDGTSTANFEPTPHVFTNSGNTNKTYDVNLAVTSDRGCTHNTTETVTVYPYVNADFNIDISEGCSPLTVTISNNSSGNEYFWFWDDSDLTLGNADDNSANPTPHTYTHTTGGTRTDSLTLIVGNGNGCYDILKRAINIHSSIDANFTFSQPDSCTTSAVTFNSNTTFPAASKYNWDFGDGSNLTTTSSTVNKQFTNNSTDDYLFFVTLSAETAEGCTDVYSENVTVYSKVIADFSIPIKADCPPFENAVIENTSIGNNSNIYEWYVDGSSTPDFTSTGLSNFVRTYDNSNPAVRNYDIRLLATNPHGCTSEHVDTVKVYEYVEASYSMDIDNGCTPLPIIFTDLSTVPASTKYTWDFGDGASSGLSDPVHTFYNPSRTVDLTYTIDLTVQSPNYCSDDTSMVIDVYHQPLATMYVPTTTSCPPLEAYMDNFNSKGYDSFEWRFGDGNTNIVDNSLVYSYPSLPDAVKYYDLKLWVGTDEGCTHTDSITLSVFPDVIADFTYNVAGCSPFTSTFTNESSATAEFFSWNFDDGTTSSQQHPIHRFENTTNVDKVYNVRLFTRNEYECSDDTIQPVTVYAQPTALFNPTPAVQTYPEATVWLNSTSNNEPWDYLWEFGDIDGTTSFNSNQILFDYEHWGEKDIKLTLTSKTSDCSDNLTKSIIIYPPAVNAAFTTNIDGGCLDDGLEVQFTAAGSAYAEVYSYTWDFGDGETGTGANIYHTYEQAGAFYVKMTASSNEGAGEDYEYKTIRVYSNPKASFEVSPKLVMLNTDLEARVEFFNLSECNDTSGCAYVWNFGDGSTSISRDVTHNYSPDPDDVPIKYDISLLVTTAHACADSLTLYEEVEIIGAGEIKFPNAFTPNGDGLNDTFRPVSEGVIKYELLVYNRWGELIFTTKDLSAGWDGKVKSEYAKPDVYVWKAQGKFTNGRSFELAGDVTLIR